MRVVSLVPSVTETLLALGVDVVACTRFCEQPTIAHVGGTKNPDIAAIVALAPDLVVVDEEENRREDADSLRDAGLKLLVTAVRSVTDALATVRDLADATGVALDRSSTVPLRRPPPPGRRAFVPIWRRPWMTINADTYGASILAHAGIDLVTADSPDRYPVVELDEIAALAPDLVLVPGEPYTFTDAHVAELAERFPDASVQRVDGQDLFWWGWRTLPAIDRITSATSQH